MTDRKRLVWHSNSPLAPTGYGSQTALFAPLLADRYDIAISCFYGLEASPIKWNNIPLLPGLGGDFGAATLVKHAEHWFKGDRRGGITMMLADVWPFDAQLMRELELACWCPVDHEPAPPGVLRFLADSRAIPIAMSRFGQEQLSDFDPLYVPHGVLCDVYKRVESSARGATFPKDAFVVGQIAANKGRPSRKSFSQSFQAMGRFMQEHDDVFFYVHSVLDPNHGGGENLLELAAACEIPDDRFRVADQYALVYAPYSPGVMAQIYSSLDVLLNPAFGEGFGIPCLEAQACSVPVIATDFTAMREVVCDAGWHVNYSKYWSGLGSWQAIPDVDDIVSALEECYGLSPHERLKRSKAARKHAMKYDVRRVFKQHWVPTMIEIEKRLEKRRKQPSSMVVSGKRRWTVSIVTPWRDHPEFMEDYRLVVATGKPDQVLVIDDGSEAPVEDAAWRFDEPGGFVQAANKGVELSTTDVVVFLNNDVRVISSDWLDVMLAAVEPGTVVGELRNEWHAWVDGKPIPYIDGWCFAMMRQDLELLGGFDPNFQEPAYFADNDLCLRAVAAGMRLVSVQVGLEHIRGGTTDEDVSHRNDVTVVNQRLYAQRVRDLRRLAEREKQVA